MTHQNFEKARENMVLSQLQPSGIVSSHVMEAYATIPREMFVPNELRGVSYLDDDIPLGGQRVLIEPLLHALMVQNAKLQPTDRCLDIGSSTGYSAAILAKLAGHVVAVEQEDRLLQDANHHWKSLGLVEKITPVIGEHREGYAVGAPYQAIFINGAVADIPVPLLDQLAEGGSLYAVLMPEDSLIGQVVAVRRDGEGFVSQTVLGAGVTPYLIGFSPKKEFIF